MDVKAIELAKRMADIDEPRLEAERLEHKRLASEYKKQTTW